MLTIDSSANGTAEDTRSSPSEICPDKMGVLRGRESDGLTHCCQERSSRRIILMEDSAIAEAAVWVLSANSDEAKGIDIMNMAIGIGTLLLGGWVLNTPVDR